MSASTHAPPCYLSRRLTIGRRLFCFSAARPLPCRPAAFLPPDGRPLLSCLRSTGSLTIPPRPHCSGYTHPTPPTVSGLREHSSGANLAPVPPDTGMPANVPSLAALRARFEYLRPCAACRHACRKRRGLVPERWERGRSQSDILASSLVCRSDVVTVAQIASECFRVSPFRSAEVIRACASRRTSGLDLPDLP